jgi:hypothetical protein
MMRSSVFFVALLGLVFVSCSSSTSPTVMTRTATIDSAINFGYVRMGLCADTLHGVAAEKTFLVRNSGNDTLRIDSITSFSTNFSIVKFENPIPPNGSGLVRVQFCPQDTTTESTTIRLKTNATSGTTTVAATGTGIAYYPYEGSNFTYLSVQLDSVQRPIGSPYQTTTVIKRSGIAFAGKENTALTSDSTRFHIENNGDVSIYNSGFPVYPSPKKAGAGWFVLPAGSHNTLLSSYDTTFDSASISIALHVRDSSVWIKDTSISVAGKTIAGSIVALFRLAHYSTSNGADVVLLSGFGAIFAPEIGFTVGQFQSSKSVTLFQGVSVRNEAGGEQRILTAYELK